MKQRIKEILENTIEHIYSTPYNEIEQWLGTGEVFLCYLMYKLHYKGNEDDFVLDNYNQEEDIVQTVDFIKPYAEKHGANIKELTWWRGYISEEEFFETKYPTLIDALEGINKLIEES